MDRSKFAVKNYEMIMQVDEDSRRRKHEMKHHMETLYALIDAGKIVQAKNYTEKMIKDTELSSDVNYSTNIVLNSIVGIRLNQAKKRGVAVQRHIHVPDQLSVNEVDLNILLSNALEACMRMEEGQEAYIGLETWKRQKFLYIECTNGVAPKELSGEQRRTIKEEVKNHGFGLEAMETVAEKYVSIIQTEQSESRYTVRTNLCLAE